MENLIACRPESYGRYADRAFQSLQNLGVKYVEIAAPPVDQLERVQDELRRYGLNASSVTLRARVQDADFLDQTRAVVASAARLNAPVIFTSQKAGTTDRSHVYALLRQAGEIAKAGKTTIVLETHPDLCENAANALATMQGVNHPNIRINFDPANVHYYNEHVNAVHELRQIAPYVRAVHLKDTNGRYQAHHFPAIGDGVVDWSVLFALMNEQGMYGPFTMEMEGIAGESLTFEETCARIARSLDYLRGAGVMA